MRNSAAIPRRRSSHHSTSDCSRQFVSKKKFRAAAADMRAIVRAATLCAAAVCQARLHSGKGSAKRAQSFQRRKPASRKPNQVASSPPVGFQHDAALIPAQPPKPVPALHHDRLISSRLARLGSVQYRSEPARQNKVALVTNRLPRRALRLTLRCAWSPAAPADRLRSAWHPLHILPARRRAAPRYFVGCFSKSQTRAPTGFIP